MRAAISPLDTSTRGCLARRRKRLHYTYFSIRGCVLRSTGEGNAPLQIQRACAIHSSEASSLTTFAATLRCSDSEVVVNLQEHCQKIVDVAIKHAGKRVDGIEVTVSGSDIATSRFANNSMTQNQSPVIENVSVRIIVNSRQSRLETDQSSGSAVAEVVDNAIAVTKLLEKDDDLLELISGTTNQPVVPERFDQATANIDPQGRAKVIKEMIEIVKQANLIGAGTYSCGAHYQAIGNSKGLFVFDHQTSAEASITVRAGDSSGWAKGQSANSADLDPVMMARRAAEKAQGGLNPVTVPPGQYTVILEPAAVLDLLGFLWYEFSGTSHLDKRSSLLNKLGEKVFGENINITDDYSHLLQAGPFFDGEGSNRHIVKLVERGIFKNMVLGRRSAKKLGIESTGHALQEPTGLGELAENIVIAGGDTPTDQMIATTERGILITRVWYVREVDPASLLVTGLTQDGTFLIEAGKIKSSVKNMRFNISIHEMLNKVLALGQSVRTAGEESTPMVVPSMKIADFNFTEHSLF